MAFTPEEEARLQADLQKMAASYAPTLDLIHKSLARHDALLKSFTAQQGPSLRDAVSRYSAAATSRDLAWMQGVSSTLLGRELRWIDALSTAVADQLSMRGMVEPFQPDLRTISRDLPRLPDIYKQLGSRDEVLKLFGQATEWPVTGLLDQAIRQQTQLAASLSGMFAAPASLEALAARVEDLEDEVVSAESEAARAYTVGAVISGLFQAAAGVNFDRSSPAKNVRFWAQLFMLLFKIFAILRAAQAVDLTAIIDKQERRLEQRRQAETIDAVLKAMRQFVVPSARHDPAPAVRLRVTKPGILREAPSGAAARRARVRPGTLLSVTDSFERWHYVSVLDKNGQETGIEGWIYRRSVEVETRRLD